MLTQDNTIPNFMEDTFAHKALTWDNPRKISMTNKFVKEIEKLCSFSSSLKILEIGTGTGLVGLQLVSKASEMLLIDTSPSMLQILEKKLQDNPYPHVRCLHATIETINGTDFDLVISFMTWHHIADLSSAFTSVYTLLKKGGKLLIGDLLTEDGSFHGDEFVPHLGFDMQMLRTIAENHGFKVLQVYPYAEVEKQVQNGDINRYGQFVLFAEKI